MQQETDTIPSFETLELSVANNVAEVFLNRGDKANSMNEAMWRELRDCFEWLDGEPAVRAVMLAVASTFAPASIWGCSPIPRPRVWSRLAAPRNSGTR